MPKKGVADDLVGTHIVAPDVPDIRLFARIGVKNCLPFADLRRMKSGGLKSHEPVVYFIRETSWIRQAAVPSHNAYAAFTKQRVSDGRCPSVRLKKTRNWLDGVIKLLAPKFET